MRHQYSAVGRITVKPLTVAVYLSAIACLVVATGSFAHLCRHLVLNDMEGHLSHLLKRFDLVEEPSLSQWYSSSLHLAASAVVSVVAMSKGKRGRLGWFGLSVIFCVASIDEAIMLHEMMDQPTRDLLQTGGWLSIAWIIPGSLVALLIGGLYLSFLTSLPRRTMHLFVAGGSIFLAGGILMEIPGGYLYEMYGFRTWHYIASYALEELLEMQGIIVFLYGCLRYLFGEEREEGVGIESFPIEFTGNESGYGRCS